MVYTLTLNYLLVIHNYFQVADNIIESVSKLNNDLIGIQEWAYQWKMSFNHDKTKPVYEAIFSRKTKNIFYPKLYFNNVPAVETISQKHLGVNLDARPTFSDNINESVGKAVKGVGFLRKLQCFLRRSSLLTIYKSLIRSDLDYGDVIFGQPSNKTFSNKIKSFQYDAALAIAGAIRGSSFEELFKELGW